VVAVAVAPTSAGVPSLVDASRTVRRVAAHAPPMITTAANRKMADTPQVEFVGDD
jgi:hypothetical protein